MEQVHENNSTFKYLIIGCADDACFETSLKPDARSKSIVHTNLGNQMPAADLNSNSVLEMAVGIYGVEEVVVCGHRKCRAVKSACERGTSDFAGNWLASLRRIHATHGEFLEKLSNSKKIDAMGELNAIYQAMSVCESPSVRAAWANNSRLMVGAFVTETDGVRDVAFSASADTDIWAEFESAIWAFQRRWVFE